MALIPCPACERQISEMAPVCPGCGHPIAAALPVAATVTATAPVQTIEQTSKQYKMGQLVGIGMILASVVACSQHEPYASAWLLVLGFVVYVAARMGAWWNNG